VASVPHPILPGPLRGADQGVGWRELAQKTPECCDAQQGKESCMHILASWRRVLIALACGVLLACWLLLPPGSKRQPEHPAHSNEAVAKPETTSARTSRTPESPAQDHTVTPKPPPSDRPVPERSTVADTDSVYFNDGLLVQLPAWRLTGEAPLSEIKINALIDALSADLVGLPGHMSAERLLSSLKQFRTSSLQPGVMISGAELMQTLFFAPASTEDDFVSGLRSLIGRLVARHSELSGLALSNEDVWFSKNATPAKFREAASIAMTSVRARADEIDEELGITPDTDLSSDIFDLATLVRRDEWQLIYDAFMIAIAEHTSDTEYYLLRRLLESSLVEPPYPT